VSSGELRLFVKGPMLCDNKADVFTQVDSTHIHVPSRPCRSSAETTPCRPSCLRLPLRHPASVVAGAILPNNQQKRPKILDERDSTVHAAHNFVLAKRPLVSWVLAVVLMAKARGPDAGDRAIHTFFQKKIPSSGVQASTGKRIVPCPPNAIQMPVVSYLRSCGPEKSGRCTTSSFLRACCCL
jgi:hypothetical protein